MELSYHTESSDSDQESDRHEHEPKYVHMG